MNRITMLRKAAGLTQLGVRTRLEHEGVKIDKALYSKLETGKVFPNVITRASMAKMFGVAPQEVATYPESVLQDTASKRPGDRHKVKWRITYRPKREAEFAWALAVLGMTPTEWFRKYEALAIQRAKKKAQAEDRSFDEGACKNTLPSKYHKGGGLSNG